MDTFDFRPRLHRHYRLASLPFGVTPSTCRVSVGDDEVRISRDQR